MPIHTVSRVLKRCVRTINLILFIATFSVMGLTASAWAWLKSNAKSEPSNITAHDGANASGLLQNKSATNRLEAVRFTILPTGFEPSEIRLPSKPFLLVVDNKSGLEEIVLQIHRIKPGNRDKLRETKISLKKLKKTEFTDLPPGRYELREADHPDWVSRITID